MFNPIKDDPTIKHDIYLRQQCLKHFGRSFTDQEFEKYKLEYYNRLEKLAQEDKKQQEQARKEREARRKAREELINERINKRNIIPEDYSPAFDTDSLRELAENNASYLEGTNISGTESEQIEINLDLEAFNLSNSTFTNVIFKEGCNLGRVNFYQATFNNVTFEKNVYLNEADFTRADLRNVNFSQDTILTYASFAFASFRRGVSIEFDKNYIATSTFDFNRNDIWARLSASYSGIWQFIYIALSGLYFGIMLFKLYLFNAATEIQSKLVSYDSFDYTIPLQRVEISAFKFIFGAEGLSITIAILILCYQSLRIFVTTKMAPLIENQKQSGYTPDRSSYISYSRLNIFINILGIVAMALFFFEIWEIFQKHIIIPLPDSI